MKNQNKKHQNASFIDEKLKDKIFWCFLFHFLHVICNISNFIMWTAKRLAQASCAELTLFIDLVALNADRKNSKEVRKKEPGRPKSSSGL